MSGASYLGVDEFAASAGFSRQAASKALARAAAGHPWRGHHLDVRQVHGRGGKHGLRYEVSLSSLSEALGDDLDALLELPESRPGEFRPSVIKGQDAAIAEWLTAVSIIAELPAGAARKTAISQTAKEKNVSEKTIRRRVACYEKHGINGLARKLPANAGKKRVHVSQAFDRAALEAGYPDELIGKIGDHIDGRIRAIWASRAEFAGAKDVGRRAEHELWKACKAHGVDVPEAAMRLSRRRVERFALYRQGNLYRNNRAGFDNGQPRVRRDWSLLQPMDRIVADVKHLDVIVTRPDGSPAWPKIVGFHDAATGRLFFYPLLLPVGEGVRQEHVIEAFIAMVNDPAWGFPKGLYLDNGSEFKCLERIRPALSLVNQVAGREIIYAKAYNAAAKTVENAFKRADTYLFSSLPGYAGRDRLTKTTQTVGRPPTPWAGTWEDFCATITGLLIGLNARPYKRRDGDKPALERFREKVEAGWRATIVDPFILDAAFCTREALTIDRGAIKVKGGVYTNEDLQALPNKIKVPVALPWRRGAAPLFQRPDGAWSQLEEDHAHHPDWKDGARDSARRKKIHADAARARIADAGHYDPVEAALEMAARVEPVTPTGRPDRLGGSSEMIALADGRRDAKPAKIAREDKAAQAKRREEAETARLEERDRREKEMRRAG